MRMAVSSALGRVISGKKAEQQLAFRRSRAWRVAWHVDSMVLLIWTGRVPKASMSHVQRAPCADAIFEAWAEMRRL